MTIAAKAGLEGDSQADLTCAGSGTIPDIFDDVISDDRVGACPLCGAIVSAYGLVPDH